jgi:hypothetical protein
MTEPEPSTQASRIEADRQLRLLAWLHFVAAFLAFAAIGLLLWHYVRIHDAFLDLTKWKKKAGTDPSLQPFFAEFLLFHLFSGAVAAVFGIVNLASGLLIMRRRRRALSVFVACLDCIIVPVGTILGAYSIVVLLRDSVREAYGARGAVTAAQGGNLG